MLKLHLSSIFSEAAVDIFSSILEGAIKPGPAARPELQSANMDIVVLVGIAGEMEGRLVLEFSQETALGICTDMNFGEVFGEFNEEVTSTLSELANLITGKAISMLNDQGAKFSITPPILLRGVGIKTSELLSPTIIPVETAHGLVNINVAVREVS